MSMSWFSLTNVVGGRALWPKMVQCQEYRSVLQKARPVLHMSDTWCDAASCMILAECIPRMTGQKRVPGLLAWEGFWTSVG